MDPSQLMVCGSPEAMEFLHLLLIIGLAGLAVLWLFREKKKQQE